MEEMDIGFQKGGNIVGMGQIEVQIKFSSFLPAWKNARDRGEKQLPLYSGQPATLSSLLRRQIAQLSF